MDIREESVRTADAKGRISLGESFAHRTMLVERRGDEIILRPARVIPEREAWLYENKKALGAVRRGLKQAAGGKFATKAPDLRRARAVADKIAEESGAD
jgi:hypothetical protein